MSPRGRPLKRFWTNDEEMAKKDDDLHLPRHSKQWRSAAPRRGFVARLGLYACVAFLCFFALYELASFTLGFSATDTYNKWDTTRYDATRHDTPRGAQRAGGKARSGKDAADAAAKSYNGPIRFPELAKSLRAISGTGGGMFKNRNVLFAASNLKSAAIVLPLACQMAGERDNYVHFALFGPSDITMENLLLVNGVDEKCKLIFHDARCDRHSTSIFSRQALCSARALYHINTYMHPQAVIVDGTNAEDDAFLAGFQDQIRATGAALIELPERANTRLAWLTKLDASSLAAWNKVHFDILIHAPPSGAGNLIRLLHSLARADLSSMSTPHLTLELPAIIEKPLQQLIGGFKWPPWSSDNLAHSPSVSLRHRIPRKKMDEEESSVRFLESFWPREPKNSHALVLSPHTEISPQFFHYVKYTLLHHRYSTAAVPQDWDQRMMGISLQHPKTLLDSSTPLQAPQSTKEEKIPPPFLWQAPSSDAVLYMGDKWVELHGYVSQLLERQEQHTATPALIAKKDVSKQHPAWLEHVLQLSRLRGYFTLYPSQDTAGAIMGVHSDLYDKPEEYRDEKKEKEEAEPSDEDEASEVFDAGSQVEMLATLPQKGLLQSLQELPLLSWDGKTVALKELDKIAARYASQFRIEVGGCAEEDASGGPADEHARDLFCKPKAKAQPRAFEKGNGKTKPKSDGTVHGEAKPEPVGKTNEETKPKPIGKANEHTKPRVNAKAKEETKTPLGGKITNEKA